MMTMNDFALTPPPSAWPLLFKFRSPVLGNGFVALIDFQGRLLAREDGGRVWIDGVNPGAIALSAADITAASHALNSAMTAVFVDFAEQAGSFPAFKSEVEKFFHDTDQETVSEWEAAVLAVQQGKIVGPEGLPALPANSRLYVDVICKSTENVTPQDNPAPQPVLAAAA